MYLIVVLLDGEAAAETSAGEDPDPCFNNYFLSPDGNKIDSRVYFI